MSKGVYIFHIYFRTLPNLLKGLKDIASKLFFFFEDANFFICTLHNMQKVFLCMSDRFIQ